MSLSKACHPELDSGTDPGVWIRRVLYRYDQHEQIKKDYDKAIKKANDQLKIDKMGGLIPEAIQAKKDAEKNYNKACIDAKIAKVKALSNLKCRTRINRINRTNRRAERRAERRAKHKKEKETVKKIRQEYKQACAKAKEIKTRKFRNQQNKFPETQTRNLFPDDPDGSDDQCNSLYDSPIHRPSELIEGGNFLRM
jgi:hypothetical protein